MYKRGSIFLIVVAYFIFQPLLVSPQEATGNGRLFNSEFFDKKEPAQITLTFNIQLLMAEKEKEEYIPAILSFYKRDSIIESSMVRVKARGISRQRHCFLPPFWLNIKKSGLADREEFQTKKIKVVTNCRGGKKYDEYLLSEYLIYKILNVITDNSFRVRLVKMSYIDTGKNNKKKESWAFLIEPEELLASRIDALQIEADDLNYRHTERVAVDMMSFFQYMIGNTDFTINGRHNMELYKYNDHTKPKLIPIPYDFDFAGFIAADYANPAEILNLSSVRDRYYLGLCRTQEEYEEVIEIFKEKEEEIYNVIDSFDYLNNRARSSCKKYVEDFYKELKKPNFVNKHLMPTCRK